MIAKGERLGRGSCVEENCAFARMTANKFYSTTSGLLYQVEKGQLPSTTSSSTLRKFEARPDGVVTTPSSQRIPQQASSYWSVSEINDFPLLLRSFGSDWQKIAAHMQTKTPVMVGLGSMFRLM